MKDLYLVHLLATEADELLDGEDKYVEAERGQRFSFLLMFCTFVICPCSFICDIAFHVPQCAFSILTIVFRLSGGLIIFTSRCFTAALLALTLRNLDFKAVALHSQLSQRERSLNLSEYK